MELLQSFPSPFTFGTNQEKRLKLKFMAKLKSKRKLSPLQKKISDAATRIQKEGGFVTVKQKRYKIDRGTAIKKAASAIDYQKPKNKKK